MATDKLHINEIRWLRQLALVTLAAGVVTMPLLSKGDLFVTPTTIIFLIGSCLLGCYVALKSHEAISLKAILFRSLPVLLPMLVLFVRAVAT